MTRIPREAREGLMRAWVAILQERHPEVTWVPVSAPGRSEDSTNDGPRELPEAA
jgi:hypothetical protein